MSKSLIVASLLIVVAAVAADAQARSPAPPAPIYDVWAPQQGENDAFHGIWIVNASTGQAYRCLAVAGSATCVQAMMLSPEEWERMAQRNRQAQPKR